VTDPLPVIVRRWKMRRRTATLAIAVTVLGGTVAAIELGAARQTTRAVTLPTPLDAGPVTAIATGTSVPIPAPSAVSCRPAELAVRLFDGDRYNIRSGRQLIGVRNIRSAACSLPGGFPGLPLEGQLPELARHATAVIAGVTVACPDAAENPSYANSPGVTAPASADVQALMRCTLGSVAGSDMPVQKMEIATGSVDEFLQSLRSPSTPPTGACGHGAPYSVPWITIVTADRRSIQPTVPLDGCLVSQRVAKAFDGLRWRTIAEVGYAPS
jgi:hypothetical protein